MKIVIILLTPFLLFFPIISLAAAQNTVHQVKRAFYVMGTSLEFNLLCKDRSRCLDTINKSIKEVNRIDKIFSNYRADSELSSLQIKKRKSVRVSKEFFELTGFSFFISVLTDGAFDISVGPLVNLWKTESKGNTIPKNKLIKSIREGCVGFNKLHLNSNNYTIGFGSDCIELDFGAVGKGYVLSRLIDILKTEKINNGLINFGGNIYALGTDLDGKHWTVKIKDPDNTARYISKFKAKDVSVSTSGGYEKYFEVSGKKYSHIIDPRTGFPVDHFSSVTVVSENPLFCRCSIDCFFGFKLR